MPKHVSDPVANEYLGPTPERYRHGLVERRVDPDVVDVDVNGERSLPYRAVDTIARLHREGKISDEMLLAARKFRTDFALARFEPLRAADVSRVPGTGSPRECSRSQAEAGNRVWDALKALGGHSSPCGCCAWWVIGYEMPLREWAMREGWSGRQLHHRAALGILVGTIGVLVAHFGLDNDGTHNLSRKV